MLGDAVVLEVVRCLEGERIWKIDFTSEKSGCRHVADQQPNRNLMNDHLSFPK